MRKLKHISMAGMAVASMVLAQMVAPAAMAWGPERTTYTMNNPSSKATFNSITDNAAVGDERDFVRIVEKGTGNTYTSDLMIEAEKEYEVFIYFHNDASTTFNDAAHNYVGVAQNTRVASSFPTELKAGEVGKVFGRITSTSTDPAAVWDEAYVRAKEALTLHYVSGSAKIYNRWQANGSVLSQSLFTDTGTFIGMNQLNGVVPGCDIYSGQVVYTLQTHAVKTDDPDPVDPCAPGQPDADTDKCVEPNPDEPTPDEPIKEPELPKELPNTGPAEVALAVIIVVAIVAGIVYWQKTHKAVKRATKRAKGKK